MDLVVGCVGEGGKSGFAGRWHSDVRGEGEGDSRTELIGGRLDVEDDDLDILAGQEVDQVFPDAVAAAGDHHQLLRPVQAVALPIVQSALAEIVVDPSGEAKIQAYLQAFHRELVVHCEFAFPRIVGEEE